MDTPLLDMVKIIKAAQKISEKAVMETDSPAECTIAMVVALEVTSKMLLRESGFTGDEQEANDVIVKTVEQMIALDKNVMGSVDAAISEIYGSKH